MNNWAEFLKRKTLELDGKVIDTSASNAQQNLMEIAAIIQESISPILN